MDEPNILRRLQWGRDGRVTLYGPSGILAILAPNEGSVMGQLIVHGLGEIERQRAARRAKEATSEVESAEAGSDAATNGVGTGEDRDGEAHQIHD